MRTAASVNALLQLKGVTPATAKRIRAIWKADKLDDLLDLYPNSRATILQQVNSLRTAFPRTNAEAYRGFIRELINAELQTHGVAFLGEHRRTREDVYYCNAGDSYATTIIFHGSQLSVGCWADYVETNKVRDPNDY